MTYSNKEKAIALMNHLKDEGEIDQKREFIDDYSDSIHDESLFDGPMEFSVYTEDEADQIWDEYLDNYIDDCILPDMPDHLSCYFDDEKWKRDARMDGRGHSLSHYDGNEYEQEVNGTTYYIYRTN